MHFAQSKHCILKAVVKLIKWSNIELSKNKNKKGTAGSVTKTMSRILEETGYMCMILSLMLNRQRYQNTRQIAMSQMIRKTVKARQGNNHKQ